MKRLFPFGAILLALAVPAFAQEQHQDEYIEVTATKIEENIALVPASITVISGEDLEERNATDLATALSSVAGVSIAQGGDAGPAGHVPEIWGLREFDAFLLVVDGVPWGGAFNPDLVTLDLTNVERIEVVRGAAPVMYGATSFVGVIHVIHRDPETPGRLLKLSGGSYSSGSASLVTQLGSRDGFSHGLTANIESRGLAADRAGWDRAHLLYRGSKIIGSGKIRFDIDGARVNQDPYSPHPRAGSILSPDIPLDANHNPRGSKMDETRLQGAFGYDSQLMSMPWTTTLSLTHSKFDIVRGFLREDASDDPGDGSNADGYRQDRGVTDIYFDTHIVRKFGDRGQIIAGFDHLYGKGKAENELFEYFIPLSGHDAPSASSRGTDEENSLSDTRNFSGLYAATEWNVTPAVRVDVGARLNHTRESRRGEEEDEDLGEEQRTITRGSGSIGATWRLYHQGTDHLSAFVDYRNSFKPAAIDFGPEAEPEILEAETAQSYEVGLKGNSFRRFLWQFSVFQNDFDNMVVATAVNGLPALENVGSTRFRGFEAEADVKITEEFRWEAGYSYHDARFRDYVQLFGDTPTQLRGRRVEMSPFHLFGTALIWGAPQGINANIAANYVGERFLNKRNTAPADSYTSIAAGLGYRFGSNEIRVDGRNLTDERPPVAESELGDGQYYRMQPRSIEVAYRRHF